jgi:serine/threonine-protein kinase HipA
LRTRRFGFADEIAIVIERFDRTRVHGSVKRVHQEDICQAMGLPPTLKYQNEGGPGVREVAEHLSTYSSSPSEDIRTFIGAVAFNWLVAGTDGHAKKYALLLSSESRIRLAPLYDLASAQPYPGMHPLRLKLAMKIGGEYALRNISARHWQRLALETHLNADEVLANVRASAEAMPDHLSATRKRMKAEGLTHTIINRLSEKILARAKECRRLLK